MTLDHQIADIIDQATRQLTSQLAERLQTLAADVSQAAAAERASVVRELRMASEAEIARRSQEAVAASQAEHARRLEEAVAAARQEGARRIDEAVGAVRAELTRERETSLMSARADVARKIDEAVGAARLDASRQHESALAAVRADAAATLAGAVARAKADAEHRLAQSVDAARREAAAVSERSLVDVRAVERHAELAQVERVADSIRRLDIARSLTEILDVLVMAAEREAPRVAVFLLRGNSLIGWRAAGFGADTDPRHLHVPLDQDGLLTRAARAASAVATTSAAPGESLNTPFGTLSADNAGLAVPVRVGGETVAVVYADDAAAGKREVPSAWPEVVEILVRHAGRCLEVLTVARVTQSAAAPKPESPQTPRYAPHARARQAGGEDDEDAARRYAKLLVSEIKLYHEGAVAQGRRDRNLMGRLRSEIDRARRLYEERVPAPIRAKTDYFGQELVRTLANGDAALLGSA